MEQEQILDHAQLCDRKDVREAISFIHENIHRPDLAVDEVAAAVYVSERTFFRMIREATGRTPYQLIRDIRLEQASKLLTSSMRPNLKRVAAAVGYTRVDHFTKLYKKKYAIHPMATC